MAAGGMAVFYPAQVIVATMPGKPPRGRLVHPEWNPMQDAQRLRQAIKGVGTDNSTVISIICNRDREHLQYVRLAYRDQFGRHLLKDIEKDTSFFFRDVLMGLCMSDAEFMAYILRKATKGAGTRDSTLIDVICSARGSQLLQLQAAYQGMYGSRLESVIKKETSGNYEKLLVALLRGTRPDWGVMPMCMQSDVEILYKATEGRLGTDERTVIETLVARSHDHLWKLNQEYVNRSRKRRTLKQCLDSETSGNFKTALQAVMTDPCHWFASRIHRAAKGLGTNDTMLIQCILLPNQWQVQDIVRILQQEYHKDLIQLIRSETSGHYRDALCQYVANCLRP